MKENLMSNLNRLLLVLVFCAASSACAGVMDVTNDASQEVGKVAGGVVSVPISAGEGALEGLDRCEESPDPYGRRPAGRDKRRPCYKKH